MHDALAVTAHLVEHASGACTSIHPGASALLTPYRGKEEIIISSRHRLDKTSADICSNTPVLRDTAKKGLVADVDSFPSPGFDEKYYRVVVCIKNIRVQVTTQHLSNVRRLAYHELSAAHQYSARHRPCSFSRRSNRRASSATCTCVDTVLPWGPSLSIPS